MPYTPISPLSDYPSRADDGPAFSGKADTLLAEWGTFISETNAAGAYFDNLITYAEEWANKAEDSLISAAAGGDESTEYSAKHHAAKASDSETAAASSASAASTSAGTAASHATTAEGHKNTAQTAAAAAQSAAGLPSLSGNAGKALVVNGSEDGVLFDDAGLGKLLDAGSFSAVASAEFDTNTAGYEDYLVVVRFYGSSVSTAILEVDIGGTLETGANYYGSAVYGASSLTVADRNGSTSFSITGLNYASASTDISTVIFRVCASGPTPYIDYKGVGANVLNQLVFGSLALDVSGDITSLTLSPPAGTLTGDYKIFGLRAS